MSPPVSIRRWTPRRPACAAVLDLFGDAREVEPGGGAAAAWKRARRRRRARLSNLLSAKLPLPERRLVHAESARRYETQVEALFAGAAAAMRRRALSLLARAWRTRDQRGLALLDLACGAGGFLADLGHAFPRAKLIGADLSPAYLAEAARACPAAALVRLNAERLPFADASLDAVTCIYLFHELPPARRRTVAAEIARVLRPGGRFAFADSLQPPDEPRLARLLEVFPAYFHEPYYESYGGADLRTLFGDAGLSLAGQDRAFLTKALLFAKAA